jgi:hypothetical protein
MSPFAQACRFPLGNGRLCPRRDRIKCPHHGVIVGRDEHGIPDGELPDLEPEKSGRDGPGNMPPYVLFTHLLVQ